MTNRQHMKITRTHKSQQLQDKNTQILKLNNLIQNEMNKTHSIRNLLTNTRVHKPQKHPEDSKRQLTLCRYYEKNIVNRFDKYMVEKYNTGLATYIILKYVTRHGQDAFHHLFADIPWILERKL